ncbi:hypothetical protein GVX82_01115 [Patescibacteria group bacterium]|jgi:predicted N-acetyltransferase YhbS|nr:hypothetical protein [Patescibacteria group bacterium]
MTIRPYTPADYPAVEALYKDSTTFGGQYDPARDTQERLDALVAHKPEAILVAEEDGQVVGTVTLLEDGRTAWLFRCAVSAEHEGEAVNALVAEANAVLKKWGHEQVLVFAPAGDKRFDERYTIAGFTKGNDYTAFWRDL